MEKPISHKNLSWIGVDLDKTLAENTDYPDFKLLKPIKGAVEAMEKLNSKGWKIIVYTARPWGDYQMIENWLDKYKIPFRRIVCGKVLLRFLVDDRAIGFRGDWDDVLKQINEPLDN